MHLGRRWWHCLCFFALGTRVAIADECDTEQVLKCFANLVHFEGIAFPFYGANEEELEETCREKLHTLNCINDFIIGCEGNSFCDDDCQETLILLKSVNHNQGLNHLYDELCFTNNILRGIYLESYPCLEKNADKYASCHNESQVSQEFIQNTTTGNVMLAANCCYFSWYQGCFINATIGTCDANATFYISYALHILVGRISETSCGVMPHCSRPPLLDNPTWIDETVISVDDNEIENGVLQNKTSSKDEAATSVDGLDNELENDVFKNKTLSKGSSMSSGIYIVMSVLFLYLCLK